MERRLTAILAADVVGYSRLMGQDETGTLERVKTLREALIEPLVESRGGHIVKLMGDGLLVEFPSIVEAIRCAVEIQEAQANSENDLPDNEQISLRIGINLGDVIVDGADIYGDGVNIAARLESIASPGGVCVSGAAFDAIEGKLDFAFSDLGDHKLKNISKPIRVYAWSVANTQMVTKTLSGRSSNGESGLIPPVKPAIAVLPFKNLSGDAEYDYFVDGVVEEVTSALCRVRDFFVVARATAQTFGEESDSASAISDALGVRYVLQGSVRKSGNRVRISARLNDSETGNTIWSDQYGSVLEDIFDVQDEIAEQVSGAIHPSIRSAEVARSKKKRPDNLDAYDHVMRAYPHLWAHNKERNQEALASLEKALELAPSYCLASALAAWCHAQESVYLWSDKPAAEKSEALRLAKSAIANLDDDATALAALGAVYAMCSDDLERAVHFSRRAVSIDPNHAWAWSRLGWALHFAGNAEESLSSFNKALALSPLDPLAFNIYFGLAANRAVLQDFEEAILLVEKGLLENPSARWAYRMLASYAANADQLEKAAASLKILLEETPDLTIGRVKAGMPNITPAYMTPMIDGLRKIGLPE